MSITKTLKYFTPVRVKKILKYSWYSTEDLFKFITRKRDPLYPPKRLNYVGSHAFKKVGDEFMNHFIKLGKLKADDYVLDIGSGIGRMAIPLSQYLSDEGKYFGFDIDKRGVKWCEKNIHKKHRNFHFEHANIYNKYYNKRGTIEATKFQFPYDENRFDFIFATSVFTHMLPQQVLHYLSQINSVLRPGGTAFLTFFSLDQTAKENIKNGISNCELIYPYENAYFSHKNMPEAEIGFDEEWITEQLKNFDLSEIKIHNGTWSGRKKGVSYQDIFVCKKHNGKPEKHALAHEKIEPASLII